MTNFKFKPEIVRGPWIDTIWVPIEISQPQHNQVCWVVINREIFLSKYDITCNTFKSLGDKYDEWYADRGVVWAVLQPPPLPKQL